MMRLLVAMEGRFQFCDRGVFSHHLSYDIFWKRYLDVFDEVLAVARIRPAAEVPPGWMEASGPGVNFRGLPDYRGPWGFLRVLPRLRGEIRCAVRESDAFLLRVPGVIGLLVGKQLSPGFPFGLEVVTDPYDSFAPGSVRNLLRPFYRRWFARCLRNQCRTAAAVAYVTRSGLQHRYPPSEEAFLTHYSSVHLTGLDFASGPRSFRKTSVTLIFVGMMERLYKGPDLLIRALRLCREQGVDLRLVMVGDGRHRGDLKRLAARLGLRDRVVFRGRLAGADSVRGELDRATIFVLPSRGEGLPRAMIEAMARGLPCIGSSVGGIPELLEPEDTVPPNDVRALAEKIREVVGDPARMERMSFRNLERAREFREDLLRKKRIEFYRELRARTREWLGAPGL